MTPERRAANATSGWYGHAARSVLGSLTRNRSLLWAAGIVLGTAILLPAILPAHAAGGAAAPGPMIRLALRVPPPSVLPRADAPAAPEWKTVRVAPGQTLSGIFTLEGFGYPVLNRIIADPENARALRTLHPGDELGFLLDPDGSLRAMRFDRDAASWTMLTLEDDGSVRKESVERELQRRIRLGQGTIESSLFAAAAGAGMSEAMVIELAEVFKYDIDFIKDLRQGDHFSVIYDEVWRDGERLSPGRVIAAEFFNRGNRHSAYLFELPDGKLAYYDEAGRPLQKALMRTPVKFSRISSTFSRARNHPVLGYTRAHKGVDYAAPRGTPIRAAGDGRITFRGRSGGYGNLVTIRHNDTYTTAYAHMNGFAKGQATGSWVRQGDVIGYVGMTGLATGPHLHYEVRVKGKHINPLTMTMPKPEPLPANLLAGFKSSIEAPAARLRALEAQREQLAGTGEDHRPVSMAGAD